MSKALMMFMGEALFNYSTNLNDVFIGKDSMSRYRNCIFFLNFLVVLYISGSICKTVEEAIGRWADKFTLTTEDHISFGRVECSNRKSDRLLVLLHEAKSHIVSLSGHLFVLDYTSIFNVSS